MAVWWEQIWRIRKSKEWLTTSLYFGLQQTESFYPYGTLFDKSYGSVESILQKGLPNFMKRFIFPLAIAKIP